MKIGIFRHFFNFEKSYALQIGLENYEIIHETALEYALMEKKLKKIIFSKIDFVGECRKKFHRSKFKFLAYISKTKDFFIVVVYCFLILARIPIKNVKWVMPKKLTEIPPVTDKV